VYLWQTGSSSYSISKPGVSSSTGRNLLWDVAVVTEANNRAGCWDGTMTDPHGEAALPAAPLRRASVWDVPLVLPACPVSLAQTWKEAG